MARDLILGTAGHIDHGKTALVKALTGIDCDRLPEEKARGITIDIGFAHLDLGACRLGIVDVPGHERFIKNMLAGATGIDLALLVVAADDSVMPQTREHLEILKLLGIRRGAIAVTKTDLVDETTCEVVMLEVRELVQGTFLETAAMIPTSAHTGRGIAELKAALEEISRQAAETRLPSAAAEAPFRMAIDRAFVVQGHGAVVTGSIASGAVAAGAELDWHPGNGSLETVRVRGLNNHGQTVLEARRGQRAALNLAGVPHERLRRGQELAAPGFLRLGKVLTVRIAASAERGRPLRHRLPVRVHIGTAETMATIALLEGDRVEPGESGLGQLFLADPVAAVWGQPFILRDSSAEHTLGGGQVLQPAAKKIRRRDREAIEQLEQLGSADMKSRALAAAWFAGWHGIAPADWIREAGASPDLAEELQRGGALVEIAAPPRRIVLHPKRSAELAARIRDALAAMHAENPLAATQDRQKLLARLEYLAPADLLQAAIDRLLMEKQLVGDARRIARADFQPKLTANQRKLMDRIVAAHAAAGFQPPEPKEFAKQAGGNAAALRDIFAVAAAEGFLVPIAEELFLHADAEAELRRKVAGKLQAGSGATVSEIRELLGTTRKFAVPLCEYLDRIGFTQRDGDRRTLRGDAPRGS